MIDEVTQEELETNGYNKNKTKSKKFDVDKQFKVKKDHSKLYLNKVGKVKYAEDYTTKEGKKMKRILVEGEGLDGASVQVGRCKECNLPTMRVVPNARWYYDDMIEEYKGDE
jgi:ribosome-binding factor A